jgi:hypothetical protein
MSCRIASSLSASGAEKLGVAQTVAALAGSLMSGLLAEERRCCGRRWLVA